jgi:hypothetical protein
MSKRTAEDKYTDPQLRARLKEEIQAGDRGGAPGQWSARKAQLLAREYEQAGGGYQGGRDETQQHLVEWTEEEWQTADGSATARTGEEPQGAGAARRYLPKKAWEELSEEERAATDEAKRQGALAGEQFVPNTPAAEEAARHAREEH